MTKVNSSHAASGHNFSCVTEEGGETANSSQQSNILHCITAEGVFKDTEVIKTLQELTSGQVKWLITLSSSIDPLLVACD